MASTDFSYHALRRGRMWKWLDLGDYQSDPAVKTTGVTLPDWLNAKIAEGVPAKDSGPGYNEDNGSAKINGAATVSGLSEAANSALNKKNLGETKWGFQFLWNPESLSITTDLNMNVTPTTADIFTTVGQAYPSMETVSIAIVLDRTNDFACFKGLVEANPYNRNVRQDLINKYYTERFGRPAPSSAFEVQQMLRLGTVYDLEYLYKTINSNSTTTNLLGRVTADNGFLTPNPVAFQLGPTSSSIAYLGWVSNVQVNHIAFTQDMIPIRTTVAMTFNVLTNSGAKTTTE